MDCKISYCCFEDPAIERMVRDTMTPLIPMLPSWLETLTIVSELMHPDGADVHMEVSLGNSDYLGARINVFSPWFDSPAESKRRCLIHEIVHIIQAGMLEYSRKRLIDPIEGRNIELYSHMSGEWTSHVEQFTQSMAFAIERMLISIETQPGEIPCEKQL